MASSSSKKPTTYMGNSSEILPSVPAEEETKPHMISAAASTSSPTPTHINTLTESLVTQSVSLLVRVLTETSDMDQAARLAESTFKYLEPLGVDCSPLSERVSAYISCQNELKKIEEDTKVKSAYAIRNKHRELSVKLHQAQEAISRTDSNLNACLEKLLPLRTRVEGMKEMLKKVEEDLRVAEEELAQGQAEIDSLEVEREHHVEACSSTEEELRTILPLAEEAEMEIKSTEQRRDKATATVNLITEELLPLK